MRLKMDRATPCHRPLVFKSLLKGVLAVLLVLNITRASAVSSPTDTLHLENRNFTKSGTPIKGIWDFYWGVLLTPAELTAKTAGKISVPATWESQGYQSIGCATYHTVVAITDSTEGLALLVPSPCTAAKVFINGKVVGEVGKAGDNPDAHVGGMKNLIIPIPDGIRTLDIVIQVSNFSYFIGGVTSAPKLGTADNIFLSLSTAKAVHNTLTGCLVAMFLYHLILFFLYSRGLSYLYLAGICLIVALRSMVINGGTYFLPELFPGVDMEYWKKIEFFSVYMSVMLFPLYIQSLFKAEASQKIVSTFVLISLPLMISVIIFPQPIYGKLLNICHLALLIEFAFAGVVIYKAWKNKKPEAPIILFGVVSAFPPIFFEILNNSRFINAFGHLDFLVETGILIFLLFQSYLLARVNANAHHRLELLYVDLEKIVYDRTKELTDANHLKDRLLSIISHDIKGPLNSLKGLLTIFNMEHHAKPEELKAFTRTVEDELQRVIGVANVILRWTSTQIKGTEIVREQFNLKNFLEEHVQFFHSLAGSKKIDLNVEVFEGLTLESDRNIMSLVLRNLISNAIKYSSENSSIHISAERKSPGVVLSVRDSGIGISHEQLRIMFDSKNIASTRGTHNEKGTGLGLILCKQYLDMIGGKIWVNSEPGLGSTFFVRVPESA